MGSTSQNQHSLVQMRGVKIPKPTAIGPNEGVNKYIEISGARNPISVWGLRLRSLQPFFCMKADPSLKGAGPVRLKRLAKKAPPVSLKRNATLKSGNPPYGKTKQKRTCDET